MNNKISDKDKKDWQNFIDSKKKILNKDLSVDKELSNIKIIKKIDLHGLSLNNANIVLEEFVKKCFEEKVIKIVVITGKGLRSKNKKNPYVSEDFSILKHSVPEYIKSKQNLMKIIKKIEDASIEDGGEGAFYIFLKKFEE